MPACCSAVACCSCTLFSKSQRERNDCENISRPSICRSYTSTVSMLSVLRATCWCLHPTCTVGERVECRVWMPAALDWLRVKCPAIIIWVQYLALLIGGPSCYPLWGDIGIPLAVAPWSPYYNIPAKTSIERERERERDADHVFLPWTHWTYTSVPGARTHARQEMTSQLSSVSNLRCLYIYI